MTAAIAVTGASGSLQLISRFVDSVSRDDEKDVSPVPPTCGAAEAGNRGSGIHDVLALLSGREASCYGHERFFGRTSIVCPGTASDAKVRTARLGAATSQSLQ